jgi:pyridoxine 5-phosphate synthase
VSFPLRLGVNIDHVATVRNARGGLNPDPLRAARLAIDCGADGITAHLREDRRHISDADIEALSTLCRDLGRPLNFEMAVTDEMRDIALRYSPHGACLVPEKREERTTEGGLDVVRGHNTIDPVVKVLREAGIRVSLFIEANPEQIATAAAMGAQVVELHTGAFCDALREGHTDQAEALLQTLRDGADLATDLGLEIHAGHGIDYETVTALASIPQVVELNIGHFLIGEAIFIGLGEAMSKMRSLMQAARAIS